jgi:hypothetical protein
VEGATAGDQFTLDVEEQQPANGTATPDAVMREVLRRAGAFASATTSSLAPTGEAAQQGQLASSLQLRQVVDQLGAAAGAALQQELDSTLGASVAPPRVSVRAQLDSTPGMAATQLQTAVGFDASRPAPFWVATMNDDDVRELGTLGITPTQIVDGVLTECGSFGSIDGHPVSAYLDTPTPSGEDVLRALLLNESQLRSVLTSRQPIGVDARIRALLGEDPPSQDAQTIRRLIDESRLHSLVVRCQANVAFALDHLSPTAAQQTQAATVRTTLAGLESRSRAASTLYGQTVAPLVTAVVTQVLRGTAAGGPVELGSFALHNGHLTLSLFRTPATTGAQAVRLFNTELEVATETWLAVSVGLMATACDQCLTSVDEVDRPAMGAVAAHRAIAVTANSYSFNSAIAVHASPLIVGDHHLGFMLGYPLTPTAGTSESILAGVTWGYAPAGLYVSLGAHLFIRRVIRGGASEVDLSMPSNANLRVTDLAVDQPGIGAFVMISLSSDLVLSLARL